MVALSVATYGEQILDGAVLATLTVNRFHQSYLIPFCKTLAALLREIRHILDAPNMFHIEPLGDLLRRKGRHSQLADDTFQFRRSHSQ